MAKVVWTEPALTDLREITDYIAIDSLIYAERVGVRIVEAPLRLQEFPMSGRVVPEFHDDTIPELIYGSYRIIYQIQKSNCYIVAIVHPNRDILRHYTPGVWDVT